MSTLEIRTQTIQIARTTMELIMRKTEHDKVDPILIETASLQTQRYENFAYAAQQAAQKGQKKEHDDLMQQSYNAMFVVNLMFMENLPEVKGR
jgi:homospermidine synthase